MERVPQTQDRRQETQAPPNSALKRLETRHNKNYPFEGMRIWCHVCFPKHKKTRMKEIEVCRMQCGVVC